MPRRVLIVEDNDDARQMLRSLLKLAGHEVHEAANGPDAVEAIRRLTPEVALIDIGLPGFDGYEVARRVRNGGVPAASGIRLIAITGYGQREDRYRSEEAGFDGHLVKPVGAEALARAMAGA